MPPLPAKIAICLAFVEGTWALLQGAHYLVTGAFVAALPLFPALHAPAAFRAVLLLLYGALGLILANLYLFQNRLASWKALLVLVIVSSWNFGWIALAAVVQMVLLLLPTTRRQLAPSGR